METAGDAYIVSSGVLVHGADGFNSVDEVHDPQAAAARLMGFAKDMLRAARQVDGSYISCQSTTVSNSISQIGILRIASEIGEL